MLSNQVLLQVDGDVDAAIEFLVAEQGTEECSVQTDAHDSPPNSTDTSHGNGRLVLFTFGIILKMGLSTNDAALRNFSEALGISQEKNMPPIRMALTALDY